MAARVPDTVPAVVTPGLRPASGSSGYLVGVPAGAPLPVRVAGTAAVLPRVGAAGMLVAWDAVTAARSVRDDEILADQVWLGAAAPPDVPARLAAAGLTVTGVETPQDRAASLARQGPALAVTFLRAGAVAAAVLAVGATVVNLLLVARRRSFELAALRALGFRPRTVTAAALAEQVLLAAVAVVVGVTLGVLAARLGLPSVPEFADGATVPPLLVRVDPVTVLAVAVALAAVLGAGIAAGAAALMSSSGPGRLREGQA
jgi:putative ABC transport system permease protein